MKLSIINTVGVAALSTAVAIVVLLAVAHIPAVRSRAVAWGLERLRSALAIDVTAEQVSYNLLALELRLTGVTISAQRSARAPLGAPGAAAEPGVPLAAPGAAPTPARGRVGDPGAAALGTPLAVADELKLNFAWSALLGRIGFDDVEISGLRLTIVRGADGSLNLPVFRRSPGSASLSRIPFGRLSVRDASVSYRDLAGDWSLDVSRLAVSLVPGSGSETSGRLVVAQGPSFRFGDLETRGAKLDGLVSYDGASVVFERLIFDSPEGRLRIDGRLQSLWSAPRTDFEISGTVTLSQMFSTFEIAPPAQGTVSIQGKVTGPLAEPAAALALESDGLSWRHVGPASLRTTSNLTTSAVTVDTARLGLADGSVALRGRLGFDPRQAELTTEWQSLSAAALLGPYLPFTVASRFSGNARLAWNVAEGWSGLQIAADNRSRPAPAAGNAVSVEGASSLVAGGGQYELRHAHSLAGSVRVAGDARSRVSSDRVGASPLTGPVVISAADVAKADPLWRAVGLTLPERTQPVSGQLEAMLHLGGTLDAPTLAGSVELDELRLAAAGPIQVTSTVALDDRQISVDRLEASLGINHATASGSLTFDTRVLRGKASLDLRDVAGLATALPDRWQPSGTLSGDFTIRGVASRPIVEGEIRGADLAIASQQIETVSAGVEYDDGVLGARGADIRQPEGGRIVADAEYAPASGAYAVTATATAVSIHPVGDAEGSWPISALLDGNFEGRGTLAHPSGAGRFTLATLDWGGHTLGPAALDVTLSEAGARLDATLSDLSTTIDATLQLRSPHTFTARAVVREGDVGRLAPAIRSPPAAGTTRLEGRVSADLSATGALDDLALATVDVAVQQVQLQAGDARLELARPTRLQYAERTLAVEQLQLRTGSSLIEASGQVGQARSLQALETSVRGELADFRPWASLLGARDDLTFGGAVAATLSATGALDRPTLAGRVRVQEGTLAAAGYPAVTGLAIDARLTGGVIEVEELGARWEGATLRSRLTLPLGLLSEWLPEAVTAASPADRSGASFRGRIEGITTAAVAPFVDAAVSDTLDGEAAVAFDLGSDMLALDRISGTATVEQLRLAAGGVLVTQVRPMRLIAANGQLRVADWLWDVSGNRLSVEGQAELIGRRSLDLRAAGQVDLRVVGAFVPAVMTAGLADLSINIGGSLTEPVADGTLRIRRGELRIADPQVAATDVNGRLQLSGQQLQIVELQGTLNGGGFIATGDLQHERFRPIGGTLTLAGAGIALNVPQGVRTAVETTLALSFSRDRTQLSGRVEVQRGAYREPLSLAAGVLGAARRRILETAVAGSPPSALERIELDVALVSREDLVVDNNYGRMDLGLDLRLVGTPAQPSVIGRATIREGGVLFLGGRTYQVERGTIDFTNPREIVPDLDLTARTRIPGYDITITITGTPETVRPTLSSDPPGLAYNDIVSLLATGQRADQVGGAGTEVAREQVLGYLAGEALGFAARAVGLDTLRLERRAGVEELESDPSLIAAEADPASRLTVSKQFSRYVNVVLSQNLREEGRLTWIVGYTPRPDVELRAVSRDDQSRSYEARHNVTFGGSRTGAGRARGARSVEERIVAVRFEGTPRFPASELLRSLRLEVGDRFDFYRWQEDRDRLRRLYLERGYLEARVGARRVDGPAGGDEPGIVLEYEIDPGPITKLDIEGYPLPRPVVLELEGLWSNAVFDQALFADLERAVRRHLAEQGFLRARVSASLLEAVAGGEKRIMITIAPGDQTRTREITFEGPRQIPADRLDALVASPAQELDAWLQPAALAQDVTALYREEGFLAARVRAGPPEFSDDRAVLPVRIDEGPAFSVSGVAVSGIEARSDGDVRAAFGVQPASRYEPGRIERGRRAVAADYARLGFNAVRATVTIETELERAAVQVILTVEEGPRQVLESVVIEGATGLDPGTIGEALRLEPGEPVNMDAWYQARRRLLDTGLFRLVDIEAVPAGQTPPGIPPSAAAPGTPPAARTQPIQARVSLERRPTWQLRYGLTVTDEPAPVAESRQFGAGLTADIQRRTLFGRAGTFGGALRVNKDQTIGRAFVTLPSLFAWPVTTNLFVSRSRRHVAEAGFLGFIEDKTSFTAEQRFKPRPSLQLAYGYQLERNHAFDPDRNPDDPLGLDLTARAARLTSTAVVDTRDDPFDASRGLFHSSNIEYAPEALGSDLRFAKLFVQQFLYFPVRGSIMTASAVRIGVGHGFGQELPPNERFLAGGMNTVRGYAENSLGDADVFGDPRGGQALVIVNQEVRFPIFRWLRGVGFVDGGNVFDRARDLSFTNLQVGAGSGLRFSTPVGLFRLDLGVPLTRSGERGPQSGSRAGDAERRSPRWHFSFGQMF